MSSKNNELGCTVYAIFRHSHISYCDIVDYNMLLVLQYIPLGLIIPTIVVILQSKYNLGGVEHLLFFHILGVIIPSDFHFCSEG